MGSCLSTFYINYNNNKKLVNASIKNAPLFSLDGLYTKCKIIDISSIINTPSDLIYDIEPSLTGGKKIAINIANNI